MKHDRVLRLGIVGLGMAGAGFVAAALGHPGFRLTGAADRSADLRSRLAADHAIDVNDDAAQLIARPDIDVVYIATPHQFHCPHAVLAAACGKHVIVEKPMALTLEDCDAMIEAAAKTGVVLVVGHTHSFDPAIGKMREIIAAGEVGRLAMMNTWNYTDFLYRPRRPDELDTATGGGILYNQIPHQVDILRYLAASPVRSVRGMTHILDRTRPTEGAAMALIEFSSGVSASMVYSGYDRFDSDEMHDWVGEPGRTKTPAHGASRRALKSLTLSGDEERARVERYGYGKRPQPDAGAARHQPHFGSLIVTCEHADLRTSADGVLVYDDSGVREVAVSQSHTLPGRSEVLDEIYQSVVQGHPPAHDGHFARGTVEICLAIQKSARERREVFI